jgi:hypothetical protein
MWATCGFEQQLHEYCGVWSSAEYCVVWSSAEYCVQCGVE